MSRPRLLAKSDRNAQLQLLPPSPSGAADAQKIQNAEQAQIDAATDPVAVRLGLTQCTRGTP
jgi:hypothetical protein